MPHKFKEKSSSTSSVQTIRLVKCVLLSFMLYNMFINIFVDSLINVYRHKTRLHTIQIVFYAIAIFLSLLGILLFILSLNLVKHTRRLCVSFILFANLIYLIVLVLQFCCYSTGLFYKYWSEHWITLVNFATNLFVSLNSTFLNILSFTKV